MEEKIPPEKLEDVNANLIVMILTFAMKLKELDSWDVRGKCDVFICDTGCFGFQRLQGKVRKGPLQRAGCLQTNAYKDALQTNQHAYFQGYHTHRGQLKA